MAKFTRPPNPRPVLTPDDLTPDEIREAFRQMGKASIRRKAEHGKDSIDGEGIFESAGLPKENYEVELVAKLDRIIRMSDPNDVALIEGATRFRNYPGIRKQLFTFQVNYVNVINVLLTEIVQMARQARNASEKVEQEKPIFLGSIEELLHPQPLQDVLSAPISEAPKLRIESVSRLVGLAALQTEVEQAISDSVTVARAIGLTWESIGSALGVSQQTVHRKYREVVTSHLDDPTDSEDTHES